MNHKILKFINWRLTGVQRCNIDCTFNTCPRRHLLLIPDGGTARWNAPSRTTWQYNLWSLSFWYRDLTAIWQPDVILALSLLILMYETMGANEGRISLQVDRPNPRDTSSRVVLNYLVRICEQESWENIGWNLQPGSLTCLTAFLWSSLEGTCQSSN